ncbi:hypothetical protein JTE90_001807 [Oedothorax gibbosus]|uniref:Uncharacterized protein n=1 Tax=Oedothorax gibbosus TaxID=931172 RepID=A0AAV6VSD3_9ARAC|nr:hypothetical protein JTE90_001807 [Oedothorax gibbosus]
MEEPNNATLEAASSRDLYAEAKASEDDCSFSSSLRDSSNVSMPICFLIKEHSKSVIHIQELQKRLSRVENVQDDVIDAIIEFRNYLSDSKSYNSLNPLAATNSLSVSRSPAIFSKVNSHSNSNIDVPCASEVPQSIIKSRSYSSKDCDPMYSEYGRNPIIANLSQKHFDLAKSKDSSTLESDKQDSGLDSDCREHHEIHPSLNKNCSNLISENNDELLQLLDEVSHRSAILQNQLAVAEVTSLVNTKDISTARKTANSNDLPAGEYTEPKHAFSEHSKKELLQNGDQRTELRVVSTQSQTLRSEENALSKPNSPLDGVFEARPVFDRSVRKRAVNGVDSAIVSSILKETNVVELQRQALIYLVDNAVLQTKLREAEHSLSFSSSANDKVENTLKEEARLLMMENRELRICLEEQKMENHALRSRLAMLERVAQSVTNENHELNLQLGESLNLQCMQRRGSQNLSSSGDARAKRSSLPEASIHCVKSKLLSNNSSFLDVTVDENPCELRVPVSNSAFKYRHGPIQSSTPMVPLQRFRSSLNNSSIPGDGSPANFHSVKKSLMKPDHSLRRSSMCLGDTYNIPDVKNFPEGTFSQDGVSKFPFNTILEKLKSNSECRLSKSASAKSCDSSNGDTAVKSSASKASVDLLKTESQQNKNSQVNTSDIVLQRRKGRNIQQRIQSILDRIVAESEDVS